MDELELVHSLDGTPGHEGRDTLLANIDGETVGNFYLVGKIGKYADLAFRYYKDGPQEVRFPMADRWPDKEEAQRIVNKYTGRD